MAPGTKNDILFGMQGDRPLRGQQGSGSGQDFTAAQTFPLHCDPRRMDFEQQGIVLFVTAPHVLIALMGVPATIGKEGRPEHGNRQDR